MRRFLIAAFHSLINISFKFRALLFQPWPLARLLLLFVLALAAPLIPLMIWEGYRVAEEEQRELRKDFMAIAEALGDDVDETLQNYVSTLQTLALSSSLTDGKLAATYEQTRSTLGPEGLVAFLSDPEGKQLFNTAAPLGSPLPSTSPLIGPAVATKRYHVSDLVFDTTMKRPVIFVNVPILKDNKLVYVFSMCADASLFQRILDRRKFANYLTVVFADSKGVMIARSPVDEAAAGKTIPMKELARYVDTTGRAQDMEGSPALFARKISRLSGWSILSFAPVSAANDKVIRGVGGYAVMVGLITVIGSLGAFYLGGIIVAPIRELQDAAEALGRGDSFSFTPCLIRETQAVKEALALSAAQRKALEQQQALLLREQSHRYKNLLGVIQSVTRQTLSTAASVEDAKGALSERLEALSRAYQTLTQSPSYKAPIANIVDDELSAFSSRVSIEGPPVFLNPGAAQTLALVVHELATNAAKYGALSTPEGTVAVRWGTRKDGENRRFHFSWRESDGPDVSIPERRGFGSMLTEDIAARQFEGEVSRAFDKDGFRYTLEAPLTAVATEA